MKITIVLLLMTQIFSAWAQPACDSNDPVAYQECLREIERALNPPQASCTNCQVVTPPNSKCADSYQRLFADGTVNVTMAWGYTDSGGSANDRVWGEYWSNLATQKLTGSCPSAYGIGDDTNRSGSAEEVSAVENDRQRTGCGKVTQFKESCGFRRTDDPEILEKNIVRNGKRVALRIRVLQSPLTISDKTNRENRAKFIEDRACKDTPPVNIAVCIKNNTPPKVSSSLLLTKCEAGDQHRYQMCRSDYVRQAWQDSIKNGDEIVMYNGHARNGGGPSFDPPKVLADGHVDYSWYKSVREGHKQEAAAFQTAVTKGKAPVFYSSNSCNSHRHFIRNGKFPSASPQTAFVMSSRTSFSDEMVGSMLASLDGAFSGSCDLNSKIQGASCAFGIHNF